MKNPYDWTRQNPQVDIPRPLDDSLRSAPRLVWVPLMAALIAVGAYADFPLGPVPFSLQTFFVILTGFILGPAHGALAAALYLAAGLIGLPVFASGTSGIAKLLGPTGGFLFSFVLMAVIAGVATRDRSQPLGWVKGIVYGTLSTLTAFAVGVPWLKHALSLGWTEASETGLLPFLPGALIKLFLCITTYRFMYQRRLLPP